VAAADGVYSVVALGGTSTTASDGQVSMLYAHGDGTYTLTYNSNTSGTLTTGADTGTYTVGANGALTVIGSAGDSQSDEQRLRHVAQAARRDCCPSRGTGSRARTACGRRTPCFSV